MSTKQILSCVAVLVASFCHAQGNVVYYGANSNALDVVFVDTTLSISNQTAIVADLNLCLHEWGKKTEILMGHDDPAFVAYLDYSDFRHPYYQGFPRNIIATPNGHALQISKQLSDGYLNAFAFAAAHSNIVAAGYAFVEFISSTNFPNIQASDWPNYYLAKTASDTVLIANAPRKIARSAANTFYPPSILNFGYLESGPGLPGTSNIFMRIPHVAPPPSLDWRSYPVIWHDGKWMFCDWPWPRD